MGLLAKLRAKFGREPTDDEFTAAKAKRAAKKATAEPTTPQSHQQTMTLARTTMTKTTTCTCSDLSLALHLRDRMEQTAKQQL
jgi:hypothetical protein